MNLFVCMAVLGKLVEAIQEACDGDEVPGDINFVVRNKSLPARTHLECSFSAKIAEDN